MDITRAPERLPKQEFDTKLPTMSPEVVAHPKGAENNKKIVSINAFWGSPGSHRPINRALVNPKKGSSGRHERLVGLE